MGRTPGTEGWCPERGGEKEARMTKILTGEQREERRGGSGSGVENKSKRQRGGRRQSTEKLVEEIEDEKIGN